MKSINPTTELPIGTEVSVGTKFGKVIGIRHAKDQFGAPINVHKIHFTKQLTHRIGNIPKYKPIDQTKEINYSGIFVIEN